MDNRLKKEEDNYIMLLISQLEHFFISKSLNILCVGMCQFSYKVLK